MEDNGLWPAYGVEFSRAHIDTMLPDIEDADIVISCGTFARLAIAMGKPTIMYDGDLVYMDGHRRPAMTWDKYKDLIYYPYQLFHNGKFHGIDIECLETEAGILDWKYLFIGEKFTDEIFCDTLRMIYNES
jgi:hypothetical protein